MSHPARAVQEPWATCGGVRMLRRDPERVVPGPDRVSLLDGPVAELRRQSGNPLMPLARLHFEGKCGEVRINLRLLGLKGRATRRDLRWGIGPPAVRLHVGAGGSGISTGAGPVSNLLHQCLEWRHGGSQSRCHSVRCCLVLHKSDHPVVSKPNMAVGREAG